MTLHHYTLRPKCEKKKETHQILPKADHRAILFWIWMRHHISAVAESHQILPSDELNTMKLMLNIHSVVLYLNQPNYPVMLTAKQFIF